MRDHDRHGGVPLSPLCPTCQCPFSGLYPHSKISFVPSRGGSSPYIKPDGSLAPPDSRAIVAYRPRPFIPERIPCDEMDIGSQKSLSCLRRANYSLPVSDIEKRANCLLHHSFAAVRVHVVLRSHRQDTLDEHVIAFLQ